MAKFRELQKQIQKDGLVTKESARVIGEGGKVLLKTAEEKTGKLQ